MSRNHPPLLAIRAFEAISRCGTFTAAAHELGTTQAAISNQIKVLEGRLGLRLFERHGRRAMLTDDARRVAARLCKAFDEIEAAFTELRESEEAVLRITASNTFTERLLARHIDSFQAVHPELEIRLNVGNRYVDFGTEQVDVAIRWGGGVWPGLASDHLLKLDFTPMCAPRIGFP
ncbi:LysR family transcriptional regulator [Sphingobium sp. WW5]|jgi:LysR family glycine cleavage system transcriptional activator|uniref:LysR family transcriptional regulator n=1 Tax=Sphingobium yanoikuyae TaxID=13690 RepID=A0A084E9V6_SPHYA